MTTQVVKHILNELRNEKKSLQEISIELHVDKLTNHINFIDILKNNTAYSTWNGFLNDISCVVYNYSVIYNDNCNIKKAAKMLQKRDDDQFSAWKYCNSCYENDILHAEAEAIKMPCGNKYLVFWAKPKNCKYWPAKLLSVNKNELNVRFFGDYLYDSVAVSKCYLYSETEMKASRNIDHLYEKAREVFFYMIKNFPDDFNLFLCDFNFL